MKIESDREGARASVIEYEAEVKVNNEEFTLRIMVIK